MRFAFRPYILAGVTIAGAAIIVAVPGAPSLPDVQVPAVQPAANQLDDLSVLDQLSVLADEGAIPGLDSVLNPPVEVVPPGALGGTVNPGIAPPDLGGVDLGPMDLGGLNLGGAANPGNPPDSGTG